MYVVYFIGDILWNKHVRTMYQGASYISRTHEERPYFLNRRPNSSMKFEIFYWNFQKIWEVAHLLYKESEQRERRRLTSQWVLLSTEQKKQASFFGNKQTRKKEKMGSEVNSVALYITMKVS